MTIVSCKKLFSCFYFKLHIVISLALFCQFISAQDINTETFQLQTGVRIEKSVSQQVGHIYKTNLQKGQVLRVRILEKGVNVRAYAVRDADNQVVSAISNFGKGSYMQESFTLIAENTGSYSIVLLCDPDFENNRPATYELNTSLNNSTAQSDIERVQAELVLQIANAINYSDDKDKVPEVIAALEKSLSIWKALGDRYWEAMTHIYIGETTAGLKNFTKAKSNFESALNLLDKAKDKAEIGYIYVNLAGVYFYLKDLDKTKTYANLALQNIREVGDKDLEKLASPFTSANLSDLGDYDEESSGKELPDYNKEIIAATAKGESAEAAAWVKMVFIYAANGMGEADRPLYEAAENRGLSLVRKIKDKNLEIQLLVGLGYGFSQLGNQFTNEYVKARDRENSIKYSMQGLVLAKSLNNQLFEAAAYISLSEFYDEDIDELSVYFGKKFINTIQGFRQTFKVGDTGSQQEIGKMVEEGYEILASKLISEERLPEALQVINFSRDKEFYDFRLFENQSPTKLTFSELERINDPFFESIVKKISPISLNTYTQSIFDGFAELEKRFDEDSVASSSLQTTNDLKEMQESLTILTEKTGKKHVTIYQFNEDEESIFLLLITPQDIFAFEVDRSDKEITEFIEVLTKMCIKENEEEKRPCYDSRPSGAKIYQNIFKATRQIGDDLTDLTLERSLDNFGAEVIHWSLTGKLRYIPIPALYDEETNQYLVEKYENVVFSRAKKQRFLSEPIEWKKGVGFGDTSTLDFVKKEIETIFGDIQTGIGGFFKGSVFMDKKYNAQAFLSIQQIKPEFVHIASHFFLKPEDAENPYLPLGDGSKLSLSDLKRSIGLFSDVDLLTLSACETAARRADSEGEEIDSLAELTQSLGAKSVIASLWKVDDRGTSALMSEFYRLRKEYPNVATSEVLRIAQLRLLNGNNTWEQGLKNRAASSTRGVGVPVKNRENNKIDYKPTTKEGFDHPYYWAPFVFYGSSNGKETSEYIQSKPKLQSKPNNNGSNSIDKANIAGTWVGKYVCGQGVTGATLKINQNGSNIEGVFEFYPLPENPTFRPGSGLYKGVFDSNIGVMQLNGERWLNQPDAGWVLVGFSGSFDENKQIFTGKMLSPNCGGIELRRQDSNLFGNNSSNSTFESRNQPAETVTLQDIEASIRANLFDEAIHKGNIYLQSTPDSKEAYGLMGFAYLFKKDSFNAAAYFEKSIILGEQIPLPIKRGRPSPVLGLGHELTSTQLLVSKDGVIIKDGNKIFQASHSDLTNIRLDNYGYCCPVVFIQGNFRETRTDSNKTKQEKKDFLLFPNSADLQLTQQGNLQLPTIICSDEGIISRTIANLITSLRTKQ